MMDKMVLNTTTIDELYSMGLISTRTFNVFHAMELSCVGKLRSYLNEGHNVLNIQGLGKKAEHEVTELMKLYSDKQPESEESTDPQMALFVRTPIAFQEIFLLLFNKFRNTPLWNFETAWDCYYALDNNVHEILKVNIAESRETNVQYRKSLAIFLSELTDEMAKQDIAKSELWHHIEMCLKQIENSIEQFSYTEEFDFLPDEHKQYIQSTFDKLVEEKLSVRAKHFVEDTSKDCKTWLALIDCGLDEYAKLCPGRSMRKTLEELYRLNAIFKKEFATVQNLSLQELKLLAIKRKYPFLISSQRQFVADFIDKFDYEPVFYLMYHYLRLSENRNSKILCLYYGIYDNQQRSLEDIAQLYGLSRERVRQLMVSKETVTEHTPFSVLPQQYDWVKQAHVITTDNTEYQSLVKREKLPENFNIFACIASLLSTHIVDDINGYNMVLSYELYNSIKLRVIREQLEAILKARYPKDIAVDIDEALAGVPYAFKSDMRQMLESVCTSAYGYRINEDGYILIPQNYIDIESELVQILEDNGVPMSGVDLLAKFKEKYPNHKYTEVNQLRPYILRSEYIGAIGKQSLYGLTAWTHIHYGSIRDLLAETLRQSSKPMKLDDLFSIVQDAVPTASSIRSIYVTMACDEQNSFAMFEGEMFGLASKKYEDKYTLIQNDMRARQSFEGRIVKLQHFIDTYHRYPTASGGENEASLQRWLYNIQNDVITLQPEQMEILKSLLQSYEGRGYPKTGTENEFLNNCKKYKEFIRQNHALPSRVNGEDLQQWYYRSKSNMDGFQDQRYEYMRDLMDFIISYGFNI